MASILRGGDSHLRNQLYRIRRRDRGIGEGSQNGYQPDSASATCGDLLGCGLRSFRRGIIHWRCLSRPSNRVVRPSRSNRCRPILRSVSNRSRRNLQGRRTRSWGLGLGARRQGPVNGSPGPTERQRSHLAAGRTRCRYDHRHSSGARFVGHFGIHSCQILAARQLIRPRLQHCRRHR